MTTASLRVVGIRALALLLCVSLVACSTNWIKQAEGIVGVLLPAATNVLTLVSVFSGKTVDPAVVTEMAQASAEINADLNELNALINGYNGLPENQKASQLDKISAVLSLAQQHCSDLMAAAHVKDPVLQTKVNAVIGLVISELQSIEQIIPIVTTGNAKAAKQIRRPLLDAGQLKNAYNAAMSAPSGSASLDRVTRTLVLK